MSDPIRELIDAAAECYDIPQSMVDEALAEVERLRTALEAIAGGEAILSEPGAGWMNRAAKLQRLARQALEGSTSEAPNN